MSSYSFPEQPLNMAMFQPEDKGQNVVESHKNLERNATRDLTGRVFLLSHLFIHEKKHSRSAIGLWCYVIIHISSGFWKWNLRIYESTIDDRVPMEWRNHAPSARAHGTYEIEKYEWVPMERKYLSSGPSLYMPWITHMLFVDLNDNFSCKEN